MLVEARSRGVPITVETCVHYLWFAAEEIPDGATEYKCAPPIRGAANREELWEALEDGLIDLVATDHSPCPPAMKRREEGRWDQAWGGIASLGLALPVMWTAMRQRGLSIGDADTRIGKWMAARPARLAGLLGQKGILTPGADADIVVFDPDATWTVTEKDLHFRHKISPYLGAKLRGRVQETWLRGERSFPLRRMLRRAARQRAGAHMSERARRAIEECRRIAADERGAWPHHTALSHAILFTRFISTCATRMEDLGMSVRVDAAGNLRGTLETGRLRPLSVLSSARILTPFPMPALSMAYSAWSSRSNGLEIAQQPAIAAGDRGHRIL